MKLKQIGKKLFPDKPAPEVYAGQVLPLKQKSPLYWFRNWRSTSEYQAKLALESDEDL